MRHSSITGNDDSIVSSVINDPHGPYSMKKGSILVVVVVVVGAVMTGQCTVSRGLLSISASLDCDKKQ